MTITTDRTAAMIDVANGMNELAIAHIRAGLALPHGDWDGHPLAPVEHVTVINGTETERRELVQRIAAVLGVRPAADYSSCEATYSAQALFGPVTYQVTTVLDAMTVPAVDNVVPFAAPPAPPVELLSASFEVDAAAESAAHEELQTLTEAAQ